ncbi:MAG: PAS domain S-box protein [Candidatus Nitrohelix vancouverensis]|uniref:histidine kinase n=1 Tax=Candidatus Nitrohelix vancouverensis TaxID=2705534 RepID=A0A7T0G381_9BACT|nr:MAG: PAS domain S-box protein [Candidatus Nitrohelix vancouverensis]
MQEIKADFDRELFLRIRTIMILRVVMLTGFVGLALTLQQRGGFIGPVVPLSVVLGAAYFLTLVYVLFYKYCRRLYWVASVQSVGDLLIVSGLLYATGGIDSPLSFLYLFVIIATSALLPRAASFLVASGASIIYGLLVDLQYFDLIEPVSLFAEAHVSFESGFGFYIIALNIASFYAVAYLASILSHRLRLIKEELALKDIDLQELQEFNQKIIQNMGNGLLATDQEGRVTSINRAGEETLGCRSVDVMAMHCYEVLPLPGLEDLIRSSRSVSFPLELLGKFMRRDGQEIFVRAKVSRLEEHEDPESGKGFIVVFEDQTAMSEMQEKISQAEQMAAVGRMSAGLAHEIRNPLASLSGSIQVLNEGLKLDAVYQKLMGIVITETERLNSIVSDFLNYSQPPKNRKSRININTLVQDVIILMKNSVDYRPAIQITWDRLESGSFVMADGLQIRQILWNLCINALHAMKDEGELRISLQWTKNFKVYKQSTIKEGLLLSIKDTGCGIPKEQLKSIYDPFYTTKDDGVGLGLATVYQIVQQAGGTIEVESEPGEGTLFRVFLPMSRAANKAGGDKNVQSLASTSETH